jgi:hypothetical protein
MFRTAPLLVLLAVVPAAAQKSLQAMAGDGARTDTGHFVAVMENGAFVSPVGAAFLSYAPAKWKAEFNDQAKVDQMTKGHLFRLGMNNWATMDLTVPIAFGDVTVPVGIWYLGVARDAGGKWSLVFIDPAKAKGAGAWPPSPFSDRAPHAFDVPLAVAKTDAMLEKLSVTMAPEPKQPAKGSLTIAWGNMKASAGYELKIPPGALEASSGGKKN